ncbi:MAG: hypothetical protein B6242_12950 [Anaerolineaceae bacterium 4572_78]|nr:MAG: hypothetical protein B6242_12950 [Anaerolineaceae bacterium 4572_78]
MLDFYTNKRILISGGNGYIATNLVEVLKVVDCNIIRLCRSAERKSPILGEARACIETTFGNIRHPDVWLNLVRNVDVIFHLAAQTSLYVANRDPIADYQSNVLPMLYLLEACRHQQCTPTVVFASTVTIVGPTNQIPVNETCPNKPITMYDTHKLMAELYLNYYTHQKIVQGTSLRLANVYGPGRKSSSNDRGILNIMIRKGLSGEPLTIYGTGENVRDYVYIADIVRAFLMAATNIEQLAGRYFVIGHGKGHTITESFRLIAERIEQKKDIPVIVKHVIPPSPQHLIEKRNFVADSSAFKQATGWNSHWSLVEGIDRTIEAYT